MLSLRNSRKALLGVAATSVLGAVVAVPAAVASPAPCDWLRSQHRITCNGARMSSYTEATNAATADATFAGGARYFVVCYSSGACDWSRV